MDKNNRILKYLILPVALLVCFLLFFVLKNKETKFPVKIDGTPKHDVVLINGKEYSLKNINNSYVDMPREYEIEIKIKPDDRLEVILPESGCVQYWDIDEENKLHLIKYEEYAIKPLIRAVKCGESVALQKFIFSGLNEKKEISFKLCNILEINKLFKDKKEIYLLKIKIIIKKNK